MSKRPTDLSVGSKRGDLTLAQLDEEMNVVSEKGRSEYVNTAHDSVSLYHNRDRRGTSMTSQDSPDGPGISPRRNYYRGIIHTFSAKLNEDRAHEYVFARTARPEALAISAACNAILAHSRDINEYDLCAWDWSVMVCHHGAVGVLPYWDENAGPEVYDTSTEEIGGVTVPVLDDYGDEVEEVVGFEGELQWRTLAPCDYDYGPVPEDRLLKRQDWLRVRVYVSMADAMSMLAEAGEEDARPEIDGENGLVKVTEYWHRPTTRIEKGFQAVVVGGIVLRHHEWDLPIHEIPLAQWSLDQVPGTRYFTSPIHDAIPLQRSVNLKEEAKDATVRACGFPSLIGLDDIVDQLEEHKNGPRVARAKEFNDVAQGARYLQAPEPQALIFSGQEDDIRGMNEVAGLNEMSTGRGEAKSGASARQIAYLNYLDSQKLSGPVRAREAFDKRRAWLTLEFYRAYSTEERRVRIYGPGRTYQDHIFRAADLDDGYDIIMENTSGHESMHANVAEQAKADLQAGQGDLVEGMERAQTGLGESVGSGEERERAVKLAERAAAGEPVQPDPTVRPFVALEVLRSMAAGGTTGLEPLIQAYSQMSAGAGAQGPGPGPQQAPGPAKPPGGGSQ